jgi:uncharacterized protein YfaS (alpha-2-macroglobulin family)
MQLIPLIIDREPGLAVGRRATTAIWPAEALPGIRPLFASKAVYDYRSDSYHDLQNQIER